jgi:hypothetical protein
MDIALYPPMVPTRPCLFCLSLQGGSVFADFRRARLRRDLPPVSRSTGAAHNA